MLFGREYMPEGAGVDPDAPRKKVRHGFLFYGWVSTSGSPGL